MTTAMMPTTARRRRVDHKLWSVLITIVIFAVWVAVVLSNQTTCAALQCPPNYTPTLTRDGCVCLMKAK
jgi:hypothetical protein